MKGSVDGTHPVSRTGWPIAIRALPQRTQLLRLHGPRRRCPGQGHPMCSARDRMLRLRWNTLRQKWWPVRPVVPTPDARPLDPTPGLSRMRPVFCRCSGALGACPAAKPQGFAEVRMRPRDVHAECPKFVTPHSAMPHLGWACLLRTARLVRPTARAQVAPSTERIDHQTARRHQ
jgi:hypothetical protein